MADSLTSVGLDVGTTSTQFVVSRLRVENRASSFSVPRLEISSREILYKGPVHFTPLLDERHMDPEGLRTIIDGEYRAAGLKREDVDTGAVIVTGESSRKENARAVLQALSHRAGDFVVATAGPDLESILAARGAGAVEHSERTGDTVLHMDIGGGTANLALIREGKIVRTGCLNVGGRLVKMDASGLVTTVSPVLEEVFSIRNGERLTAGRAGELASILTQVLEMAAGLRPVTDLYEKLQTRESAMPWKPPEESCVLSFSGGVARCIREERPWLEFGDIGVILGRKIRESALCRGNYLLGEDPIRATVIGAGCHSAQLSGSTVFCRNVSLPMKNLRAVCISPEEQWQTNVLQMKIRQEEGDYVLALPGVPSGSYGDITALAQTVLEAVGDAPIRIALEADMAKALGQVMALRTGRDRSILCIDSVQLDAGSFLDVGTPIGPAFPVVVKTLILQR